jgi:hypothetical protein
MLFRTNLSETVRYLTTYITQGEESVVSIEAISGRVVGSRK